MFRKFIGDKHFYKMVLTIAIPIMVQNGITNFVGFLDNIMIGQVGTDQMSGVAIVNQLMFVFNICIFGIVSGAGLFGAQFYGKGDHKGLRDTFRFRILICILAGILSIVLFLSRGSALISLYLHEGSETGNIAATLQYGQEYLLVMVIGLIPFALTQAYSSVLRETGETVIPMLAGISAVFVNLILNYILIFGKFGAPALGVTGGAIATVISRFLECAIIIIWTHTHQERNQFIRDAYRSFRLPLPLTKQIIIKGTPLMINEALWASGMAVLLQCYSNRGLAVVAGMNISNTINNVFNIVYIALGDSVAIIIGQLLGANKMEEAKEKDTKLIFFSTASCFVVGAIMVVLAPLFPSIYNTSDEVKTLATQFIRVMAVCMPLCGFLHASYFTIRSGGKTIITFIFDSCYMWVISIPFAYVLTHFTPLAIVPLFFICQSLDLFKCVLGYILVKKGIWLNNIVDQ
ncbi:MAG: MATE family efflux transporter [Lachnospiraceae bacterium]|nr:MATE family efflux transporter [Lachnospiraceae bacterium]